MSKPHVYGEFDQKDTRYWKYDRPLFSKWTVSWVTPASCRHFECGEDWNEKEFATWIDAIKFANEVSGE